MILDFDRSLLRHQMLSLELLLEKFYALYVNQYTRYGLFKPDSRAVFYDLSICGHTRQRQVNPSVSQLWVSWDVWFSPAAYAEPDLKYFIQESFKSVPVISNLFGKRWSLENIGCSIHAATYCHIATGSLTQWQSPEVVMLSNVASIPKGLGSPDKFINRKQLESICSVVDVLGHINHKDLLLTIDGGNNADADIRGICGSLSSISGSSEYPSGKEGD